MKHQSFPLFLLTMLMFAACQPANRPASDAAMDTTAEQTAADSVERLAFEEQARMEQARVEEARRDSIREALDQTRIVYDDRGPFVVQLSAWRSREAAERQAALWREKGFNSFYIEESGDASTGDVWYRVRIGRFADLGMAEKVRGILASEHGADSWIGTWERGS